MAILKVADRGTQSPSKLAGSHGYGFGCRVGGFFSGSAR